MIAIIGSGTLAQAVCRSLAIGRLPDRAAARDVEILVIARNQGAAASACAVAGALAAAADRPLRFRHVRADLLDGAGLTETLHAAAPLGVVLCASYQSPWERLRAPSAWTALLGRAGFGLSLPLQAVPATSVASAIGMACPGAWFVNTCFPDAVNPVLACLGLPVTCGAGNVAMLAAALQYELGLADRSRLKLLAHHVHLHAPAAGTEEAMAWLDDRPVAGVTAALAMLRAAPRPDLVHIAGASAASVAEALLAGDRLDANLPGPLGLPGGYPVRVDSGTISLRLPDGLGELEAVSFNQRAALNDGVLVDRGTVTFGPAARAELGTVLPRLADGFPVTGLADACEDLLRLRARLRASRPGGNP